MPNPNNVVYANTGQLERMAELLQGFPKSAAGIMNRVLSRAADTVRVETARQIPKVFGAPQKEIKSALASSRRKIKTIVGAVGTGSVSVEVIGQPLTVIRFRHSPTVPPAEKAQERERQGKKARKPSKYRANVLIYRDKGMRRIGPVTGSDGRLKSVFIAPTGAKNPLGVPYIFFYRTGVKGAKGREEIKAVRTLSVPQMVTNEKVAGPLVAKVNETIAKRAEHELNREFGNLGSNLRKLGQL